MSARLAVSQRAGALQCEQKASGESLDYNGWALILIIAPLAFVALAVALDKRSRRGYGLGALALGTLVLALWGFGAVSQAPQPSGASSADGLDLEIAVVAAVYVYGGLYVALSLTLGAIVETVIARQWWWLGIIVTVSVVSTLVIFTTPAALLPNMLGALGLPRGAAPVVVLLPPVLLIVAYAISRSIRRLRAV